MHTYYVSLQVHPDIFSISTFFKDKRARLFFTLLLQYLIDFRKKGLQYRKKLHEESLNLILSLLEKDFSPQNFKALVKFHLV